jgi:hypothetical protein
MEHKGAPGAELEHCGESVGHCQVRVGGFVWCVLAHRFCSSVCKFLYRNRPEASDGFSGVEAIQRYKMMRNRLQSKALAIHKTANDLEVKH